MEKSPGLSSTPSQRFTQYTVPIYINSKYFKITIHSSNTINRLGLALFWTWREDTDHNMGHPRLGNTASRNCPSVHQISILSHWVHTRPAHTGDSLFCTEFSPLSPMNTQHSIQLNWTLVSALSLTDYPFPGIRVLFRLGAGMVVQLPLNWPLTFNFSLTIFSWLFTL